MNKLMSIYKKFQEIIHYGLFGILTTVVNIGTFYLFETILSFPYLFANAIAIFISIVFAYVTNKKYVFKTQTTSLKQTVTEFLYFFGFRLISGLFDMGSMFLLVDGLNLGTNLSKVLTQFVVVVSNYLFSKFFIFKEKK
ncbi:GtrA family protein [Lacticigenium naphthae]|uniref:GtrA family protein n=1 Tax=Lacticigenium naphthae TaxID=515351 RepID=UPI00042963A9|nr:GtrA family protein [Lacticigenium naphthae]